MRPTLRNSSLHNPFYNRFNDPVQKRIDDLQAYAYLRWVDDRNQPAANTQTNSETWPSSQATRGGRMVAGAFALFLLLIVVAVVSTHI